ncbi:MAG: hypothetical protein PHX45_05635 [Acidobacteriota bacterium]|nr:hypothetical protein [Acidobacteriota bacterium]
MSDVRIQRVKSRADLKEFIRLPWRIYEGDPNWVPPLILDVKEKLNKRKNPFFEHADMELFLARRNKGVTGRIAAIVDDNHNAVHNEKVVFFGMYESVDDSATARALLDHAAAWGRERGMTTLRGPMNLSLNDECAFLLEGFDSPPTVMMPYNPPFYLDLMEKSGLSKAKDLYAFFMERDHVTADKVGAITERVRRETKFTLRTIDVARAEEEAESIAVIYNDGWENNWGFVPWTENEMRRMVKNLKRLADPSLVIIAEDRGRPAGFAFGLPNYNEVLQTMNGRLFPFGFIKFLLGRKNIKGLRAAVFGVLQAYRHTGLSYLLYDELNKNGIARGYEWGEMSWQLEDNEAINRFAVSIGGRIYKKYRIFEKEIAAGA